MSLVAAEFNPLLDKPSLSTDWIAAFKMGTEALSSYDEFLSTQVRENAPQSGADDGRPTGVAVRLEERDSPGDLDAGVDRFEGCPD